MSAVGDMTGRVVLVSGASSGIGKATAELLAARGARIALLGRDLSRLKAVHDSLPGSGHVWRQVDLEEEFDSSALISGVVDEAGPLSGFVHAAGIQIVQPLRVLDPAAMRRTLRVNVETAVLLLQQFRIKTHRTPAASAVLVSSVMGTVGQPGQSAYAASKSAVNGLVRSLSLELAREGVRINSVAPGLVDTPMARGLRESLPAEQFDAAVAMHPLGLGQPDDVARAIAFLLSDEARWITGSVLAVDGGYTAH